MSLSSPPPARASVGPLRRHSPPKDASWPCVRAVEAHLRPRPPQSASTTEQKYFRSHLTYPIPTAVLNFVDAVAKKYGRLDICVANAGGPPAKNFLATSPEDWKNAVQLNLLSTVYLAHAAIPHMQRQKWGRIVTITSITTKQPVADLVLSNAVRAGVMGLVRSLANEFGKDGILVNNVGPGFTATDRLKELAAVRSKSSGKTQKDIFDAWAADAPLRRLGEPREVADAIVWLASERASYITGQTFLVDGGLYKGL